MKKRSVSIHGHATSVALEPEFWAEVDRVAEARGLSVSALLRELDDARLASKPEQGLASFVRVFVLGEVRTANSSPLRGGGTASEAPP